MQHLIARTSRRYAFTILMDRFMNGNEMGEDFTVSIKIK